MASARRWPESLRLERAPAEGAVAQGLVVPRTRLAALGAKMAAWARAGAALQLCFSGAEAVIWSADAADLPWFGAGVVYLGAPAQRIFTPVGYRLATPAVLMPACLAELERRHGVAPPLLVRPGDGGSPDAAPSVLDLRRSVAFADVDWTRLASERS